MDNKPLEFQAEKLIESQLIRFDLKVTKPSFDKNGADLLIIDNLEKTHTRFLVVQCKGRTLKKSGSSTVRIPINYVEQNFVVFIYTIDENKNEQLFLFFQDNIKKWSINKKEYVLTLTKNKIDDGVFNENIFNRNLAEQLNTLLKSSELKKYTSAIIDGIFLEKAFDKAINVYQKIYPNKEFIKPDINSVIKSILDHYDKFHTEKKVVNCYLLLSESFHLENRINIDYTNNSFITNNGNQVKIYINKTNEMIGFEVLAQLERLINNDNIILVADDRMYEDELNKIKNRGVDIILVKLNENNGGNMFVDFSWGDIIYPLGISIGLYKHEL